MPHLAHTNDLSTAGLERFDAIIDVRSPSEFAEDHLPGALNLPVLDDEERALVGTHYTQISVFEARRMGAALVSRNIARHLETTLADKPKQFRPLVYCWRGGMRSQSMALVLASVGWKPVLIEGGYRTWRRDVVAAQDHVELPRLILVDGQTGTAKTALLKQLEADGEQIIDLEGLAHHRGSIFGDFPDADQPSQKAFETALHTIIRNLDRDLPVYVEAESRQVGRRRVPPGLWAAMQAAPRLVIRAPVDARAEYLVTAYPDLLTHTDKLVSAIDGLRPFHAKTVIADWLSLAEKGDWTQLAVDLVTQHYDPAYDRARKRQEAGRADREIETDQLDPSALVDMSARIRALPPL
ncbi:tRNA 2-selenouridine(34) synthase MnmH [Maricaulis parjimensis]|uniref:tRNA 2-selenouridine(34) synthase MnmH n=1 Tax=Maricaulis parjimensis TaxID=144023 RepID=UPI00193A877F|nr:tRNA 2-selenouridine(34) synthase MnmH [Maricaulis parjimensis]